MSEHKWPTAHDWLAHHLQQLYEGYNHGFNSRQELYNAAVNLSLKVDPDDIQDVFEYEMDNDGYFDEQTT